METTMSQALLDSDAAAVAVEAPNANNLAATKTWRMTGSEVTELKALDQAVEEYMKQYNVPGGSIAVARNGKLIFARGYSWSEPTQETTSPTSLFRIASCTKPLTRIGIHKLIENHSLSLTDNVQSILQLTLPNGAKPPKDPKPADLETDGYYFNEVQVDHLMRHSGGWDREKSGFNEPTFFKDMEVAQAFSKGLPVTCEEIAR